MQIVRLPSPCFCCARSLSSKCRVFTQASHRAHPHAQDTVLCVARRFSAALGPDWIDLEEAFKSSDDADGVQREVQQLSLVSYVRSYFEQVTSHADLFASELSEGLLAGIRPFYVY